MKDLNLYDVLHYKISHLHTSLHIIDMHNTDLAKEILDNNPNDKWKGIANNFTEQHLFIKDTMEFMLRMRTEIENLSKENKGYNNFAESSKNTILAKQKEIIQREKQVLEKENETLRKTINDSFGDINKISDLEDKIVMLQRELDKK